MNISGTEQVALAGMVLSFFCLYGRNRGSFFGSLDSQVQSRLTLGTGGQDFLGANLPLDRVQTYLGRASGHGSNGPDSPPLHCQREPIPDRKLLAGFRGMPLYPGECARPSWLQPPGCRMIKWVLIAAQGTTLIILVFIQHSVSKGLNIHSFFFFKKKFIELFF